MVFSVTDTYSFKNYATEDGNGREKFIEFLMANGYEKHAELEGQIVIYKK